MRYQLFVPALLALAAPALGQNAGLQDILSGKGVPVSLHLKDLNSDWSSVSVGTAGGGGLGDLMSQIMPLAAMGSGGGKGGSDAAMGMAVLSSMFGGGSSGQQVHYTKGVTTTLGGETFLVTYRYVSPAPNFMQLIMESQANGGKEPDFSKLSAAGKLTPDSVLTLSLVNVKSINTLGDIRPFDMAREIANNASSGGLWDMLASQSKEKPTEPVAHVAPAKAPSKPGGKP